MGKKINNCMNCFTEQSLVGVDEFYCERCGAKNSSEGWVEQPDPEESKRQQDFYDNGESFRDKQDYERSKIH